MTEKPILILQMQRMGDLVLSFPLLGWLGRMYPKNPLWVVGEESFFTPLLPIAPQATFFSYAAKHKLGSLKFEKVINLSHRAEAAKIAGEVATEDLIGAYLSKDTMQVRGNWQLYRTSITQNNRYNLFHWADLNALDIIPAQYFKTTRWPLPQKASKSSGERIGLFLGASEAEKRPDEEFWIELIKKLLSFGYKPVLLGGKEERIMGARVAKALNIPALNLCARFSVKELAEFIQNLDLFVTPDTGPMHVATWVGTRVLNLSLGPVNPWETAPFCPHHFVLRANMDCVGCWSCTKDKIYCKEMMKAELVASQVQHILSGSTPKPDETTKHTVTLELLQTARNSETGLFYLNSLTHKSMEISKPTDIAAAQWQQRRLLAEFWQNYFLYLFKFSSSANTIAKWTSIQLNEPEVARQIRSSLLNLLGSFIKNGASRDFLSSPKAWQEVHSALWPLTGYLQMFLDNEQRSKVALRQCLCNLEEICAITA